MTGREVNGNIALIARARRAHRMPADQARLELARCPSCLELGYRCRDCQRALTEDHGRRPER